MINNKLRPLILLVVGILYGTNTNAQKIERITFSAAASANNNFQPIVGAAYGASISNGSGSLEVSAEYGESNYEQNVVSSTNELNQSSIKVYPNPTNDKVFVNLKQMTGLAISLTLTDIQGKLITQQEIKNDIEFIDFKTFNIGVYILNIELSNGKKQSYRIFKKQ